MLITFISCAKGLRPTGGYTTGLLFINKDNRIGPSRGSCSVTFPIVLALTNGMNSENSLGMNRFKASGTRTPVSSWKFSKMQHIVRVVAHLMTSENQGRVFNLIQSRFKWATVARYVR